MLIFSHRGFRAAAPENTLHAFEAALALGADGIETDVRLSRDGLPLLLHDRLIGGREVAGMTRGEIEAVLGHAVPALDEALERFPDALWNIEIKTPQALPAALSVLCNYQQRRRIFVTSFFHDAALQAAQALSCECGLLFAQRPLDLQAALAGCAACPNLRSLVWDYNIIDAALLKEAAAAGWRNYAYGMETREEHAHCAKLGLAGMITDYPERAAEQK